MYVGVRPAEVFCWSFRPSVSVLECVFLVTASCVCVCVHARVAVRRVERVGVGGGWGGADSSPSLTAKTTASSDTAPAPVCFAAAARKVDSDCTGRAAGGPLTAGQWSAGDNGGPVWSRLTTLPLAGGDVTSAPREEVTALPSPVCGLMASDVTTGAEFPSDFLFALRFYLSLSIPTVRLESLFFFPARIPPASAECDLLVTFARCR